MSPRLALKVCRIALGATLLAALLAPVPARSQTQPACSDASAETPETFGPTDINAVTGNRRLTAAVNQDATITVLKWPSPSYYDQIKYRTTDRSEPRFGALPNEGAFVGIGYKEELERWRFDWLREWPSTQRFADDDTDEIVTTFRKTSKGLRVVLRDVVAHDEDALTRSVTVRRSPRSRVTRVRVIAFANFNPVYSKTVRSPTNDWCTEGDNDEGGAYDGDLDAVMHSRTGVDDSTGAASSVSMLMAFDGDSDGHQIGADTYEVGGSNSSAYDDAGDVKLMGVDSATGQVDAALADQLSLRRRRSGTTSIHIVAASTPKRAAATLKRIRARSSAMVRRAKARWWREWLEGTRVPRNAPGSVVRLAKRSLISARQAADRRGLIVASAATQAPHGVDWVRNGAYINRMLDVARHGEMVEQHNLRYAGLMATSVSRPVGGEATTPGNWSENFYADGVVGGAIPYELDATGLGIWTLWDHYRATRDDSYLLRVYSAIQRGAHYLSDAMPLGCSDPATGLQCSANEEGSAGLSRTIVGAQAAWLGLDAAVRAARALGTDTSAANAEKWAARRDELAAAIDSNFFIPECTCYSTDHEIGGTHLWPVAFKPYGSNRADGQAEANWKHVARAMAGKATVGGQESRAILGNAYAWAGQAGKMRRVKRALRWVASVPTTPTGLLGRAWMRYPRERSGVVTMLSQPHVWAHSMFYLASLKAYGAAPWRP